MRASLGAALVALVAFTACAAPPPDPAVIIGKAADDLAAATSLRFVLGHEGKPVPLDPVTGVAFLQATGEYKAPDKVHAKVKVAFGPTITTVDALWIPEGQFVTDPFTGLYRKLPAGMAIDAGAIFGKDGVPAALRKMKGLTLVGTETLDGTETHHIKGTADGVDLRTITGVLVPGTHNVDVWIDKAKNRLVRAIDRGPDAGDTWTLDLSGSGEPVEIPKP